VLQERRKVHELQQQLELETSRLEREQRRAIETLTRELKTATLQLQQQLQSKARTIFNHFLFYFF